MKFFTSLVVTFTLLSTSAFARTTHRAQALPESQSVACFADYTNNTTNYGLVSRVIPVTYKDSPVHLHGFIFNPYLTAERNPYTDEFLGYYTLTLLIGKGKSSSSMFFHIKSKTGKGTGGNIRYSTSLTADDETLFVNCDVKDE